MNKAIRVIEERTVTSQEPMLTLARQTCINKGFILHQQSARHMKSLTLRAVRQSPENPIPLCLRPLISPRTCYVIPHIHPFLSISAALGTGRELWYTEQSRDRTPHPESTPPPSHEPSNFQSQVRQSLLTAHDSQTQRIPYKKNKSSTHWLVSTVPLQLGTRDMIQYRKKR